MLVRRIHRKHTVNRFHSIRRMDSRKDHVASICCGKRNLHRFKVTNFAHEEHIRILTERSTECIRIRKRIHADFTLRDNRHVITIKVFNRVFDRNDVHRFFLIDVVNHRSKRCGLTRTRRTRHKHKTALSQSQVTNHFGQVQIFESRNHSLDMTNHNRNCSTLTENVHTETAHITSAHGKVAFLISLKTLLLVAIHDIIQEGIHHSAIDAHIKKSLQSTIDTINRRNTNSQMQVRRLAVYHFTQELFNAKFSHIRLLQTFRGKVSLLLPDGI